VQNQASGRTIDARIKLLSGEVSGSLAGANMYTYMLAEAWMPKNNLKQHWLDDVGLFVP